MISQIRVLDHSPRPLIFQPSLLRTFADRLIQTDPSTATLVTRAATAEHYNLFFLPLPLSVDLPRPFSGTHNYGQKLDAHLASPLPAKTPRYFCPGSRSERSMMINSGQLRNCNIFRPVTALTKTTFVYVASNPRWRSDRCSNLRDNESNCLLSIFGGSIFQNEADYR